jgi:hypothetical protein
MMIVRMPKNRTAEEAEEADLKKKVMRYVKVIRAGPKRRKVSTRPAWRWLLLPTKLSIEKALHRMSAMTAGT